MEPRIVNPDAKYPKARLIEPTTFGYVHLAAEVSPLPIPPQRLPFLPDKREKTALLDELKTLGHRIERLDPVRKVTVFEAVAIPPTPRFGSHVGERAESVRAARFDVAILVETESPEDAREVQESPEYLDLVEVLEAGARSTRVTLARNAKRIGDVDESRDGLFLFNHFVADDTEAMMELWEYLAGWYQEETGLDNSVLLAPLESQEEGYAAINHARWDVSLPRFLFRQLSKKSFRSYVLANMEANRVEAMPILYRLAGPRRRADGPVDARALAAGPAVALVLGLALGKALERLRRR